MKEAKTEFQFINLSLKYYNKMPFSSSIVE